MTEADLPNLEVGYGVAKGDDAFATGMDAARQIEEALQENLARLTALIDNLQQGVLVEDDARRILHANREFCRLFGIEVPHHLLIGADCAATAETAKVLFVDPEGFVQRIEERLAAQETVIGEEMTLADGRIFKRDYVPIRVGDERCGHLWLYRDATERKRAEETLRERERFLTVLNDITRAALETPDLSTMVQTLADRLGEVIDADGCYLTFWDEATQTTIPAAAHGEQRHTYPLQRPEPGELTMTESVLRAGRPLVAEDVLNSPHFSPRIAALVPARSLLGLPLIAGERKLGAALIAFNEPHRFTPAEIARGEMAARHVALALARARLLDEAQVRWREAETLRQAGAAVTESLNLDETLSRILEQLAKVVSYDSASVQLLQEGQMKIVAGRGFPDTEAIIGLTFPVDEDTPDKRIMDRRESLILADAQAEHPFFQQPPHDRIRSWMGVPLIVHDRMIGLLTLDSVEPGHFDQEHVRLVVPFANQAAIAIEHARLVEGLEAEVAVRTAEIRAEREKSETILRSVGEGIAMMDLDFRIQYVNHGFTVLTGYTPAEALGLQAKSLIGERLSAPDWQALRLAMIQGEMWQGEVVIRRKDGRTYDAILTVAPVRDAEGRLIAHVASHQDISQHKELDRARHQFLTNVSHQLRTPVTNVKFYTHLLRRSQRPDKIQTYLETLEQETDRLVTLIQDTLEMAELDSGEAMTAWEEFPLSIMVENVVVRYQDSAEAKDIALTVSPISHDLPPVRGYEGRLTQALGELVENAIIFTLAGGQVMIEVEAVELEGQSWITVAVRDTGPGIAPEEQAQIFERFHRGSLAESGHIPGSGLGLSIVQEIMRVHGGRVTVESRPGQGSTFTLWLRTV